MLDPPYPAVAVEIETLWNQASDEDHAIRWLLNELAASVGDLGLFLVHLRVGLAF
jgi:hypothetical protein